MVKRVMFLTLALILILIFPLSAEEEEFVITTYYPSPYGVYKNLRIYPNDDSTPGETCPNAGEMYFDASEQTLYICSNGIWKPVPGATSAIPSGMIAMFDRSCPTGWTRFTALDGKVPKGAESYGSTGGSEMHSHSLVYGLSDFFVWTGTTTTARFKTAPASSWPPYVTVVWCKKD